MKTLDWSALMRAGLVGLRLTPDQFWRLTPAELSLMLGQGVDQTPMGQAGLASLMAAFPDQPIDTGEKNE
ncbi:rcc01693 family protein [Parasedimentitalea huanghaiensis]|uniref:Phage tail assembly chaperone n=1 Tax=Parasedimentitalea huanghaiensis TaxID=2682100 RepID=A0A6L6WC00_9RHOB|nr:rcc01693 family protein [Zongyanglinia huanghaiensis]MVO14741.1 phage tail assembly chaperone [Zongyanglinia huanghaiensis]